MERTNPWCLLLIANSLVVSGRNLEILLQRERERVWVKRGNRWDVLVERGSLYSRVRRVGEPLFYNGLLGLLFIMSHQMFYIRNIIFILHLFNIYLYNFRYKHCYSTNTQTPLRKA
jgi:hypothetical protein